MLLYFSLRKSTKKNRNKNIVVRNKELKAPYVELQIEVRECLLFGAGSFVLRFAIQKFRN